MQNIYQKIDFGLLTGQGVSIAIIDSGVDPLHPKGGTIHSNPSLSTSVDGSPTIQSDSIDPAGHGTACAWIIRQIAPEAILYSLRIFGETLQGECRTIVSAIRWAIAQDVDVINLSLGTTECPEDLREICREAVDAGIIIVAADHNEGLPGYPAPLPEVIGVGGTTIRDPFGYIY